MRVDFTAEEIGQVCWFVEQIKRAKPNVRRTAPQSEEFRDGNELAGKLGEVAFGRHFGRGVDWEVRLGGDVFDFQLEDGTTVDTKAVLVLKNIDYDFTMPLAPEEMKADYYVQVLVDKTLDFGVLTGWIGREDFLARASKETSWSHRGVYEPLVIRRSQLSLDYPEKFHAL